MSWRKRATNWGDRWHRTSSADDKTTLLADQGEICQPLGTRKGCCPALARKIIGDALDSIEERATYRGFATLTHDF